MKHPQFGTKMYGVSGTNIYSGVLVGIQETITEKNTRTTYFLATPSQLGDWRRNYDAWKRGKKQRYSYEPRIHDFANQWPVDQCHLTIGNAALAISKGAIAEYGMKLEENRRKKRGKKRSK